MLLLIVAIIASLLSLSMILNYFNCKNAESQVETFRVRINEEDCNYRSLVSCEM